MKSLLFWLLIFAPWISFANVGVGLFSESRLVRGSDQSAESRVGFGVAISYQQAPPWSYRLEFAQYDWVERGNYMRFENSNLELRPWLIYSLREERTFKIYSSAMLGASQAKTDLYFGAEKTSQTSAIETLFGLALGGELKIIPSFSLNAEGRLFWSRFSDPNPTAAFLTQAVFRF